VFELEEVDLTSVIFEFEEGVYSNLDECEEFVEYVN
jgi:hypothetical protein